MRRRPGLPGDVTLVGDLPAVVRLWRGDRTWAAALRDGSVRIEGAQDVRRALPHWLRMSPFAAVTRPAGIEAG